MAETRLEPHANPPDPAVSLRAREIPPFIVMDVLEKAKEMEREGRHIIHLEIGEPDFDTPRAVKDAAMKAIAQGDTHYTPSLGIPELREAIAEHYHKRYGVDVSPDRIMVTSGTSPAMLLVFQALLNPGDEVLMADPHYACYPNFVRAVDGVPVGIPVFEADGFRLGAELVREYLSPKTRAILINSPSNPTGTLQTAEDLAALAGVGPYVVSDEIYHGLVYEGREHSILEFTDRAFVVNGFSKLYAMTGWRLGYVIMPPAMVRPMQKLQQNLFICASSFAQRAAVSALRECREDAAQMVRTYDERRRFMLRRLSEIGFRLSVPPTGAFYVFADARRVPGLADRAGDSYRLAFDLLDKAGVAVAPGIDFGTHGEGHLRFSYANSIENIEEGMRRLAAYIGGRSRST